MTIEMIGKIEKSRKAAPAYYEENWTRVSNRCFFDLMLRGVDYEGAKHLAVGLAFEYLYYEKHCDNDDTMFKKNVKLLEGFFVSIMRLMTSEKNLHCLIGLSMMSAIQQNSAIGLGELLWAPEHV